MRQFVARRQPDEEEIPPPQLALLRQTELLDFMLSAGIAVREENVTALALDGLRILRDEMKRYAPPVPLQPKWGKSFDT